MSVINKLYSAHLITPNTITVVFNHGSPATILRVGNEENYERVANLLREGRLSEVPSAVDKALQVTTHSKGKFNVQNGLVVIDGEELPHALSEKLLELVNAGEDTSSLENFWDNLSENPTQSSKDDLYEFLLHNQVPLTSDGCFVVYKKVGTDFKDLYTHTIDNSVGRVVSVPRESVDGDRNNTCSRGLHVAAFDYANNSYGSHSDIIIECKVNPADVVAVPPDYNQQKMRVCRYEVVRVVSEPQTSLTYKEMSEEDLFDDDMDMDELDEEKLECELKDLLYVPPATVKKGKITSRLVEKFRPFEVSTGSDGRLRIPGKAVRQLGTGVGSLVTAYIPRGGKTIKLVDSNEFVADNARVERLYSAQSDNSVRLSPDLLAEVGEAEVFKVSLVQGELRISPQ